MTTQETIGSYKILSELPGTGLGITYKAVNPSQGEQILAVKVLKLPYDIDPDFFARFQREIQLLAILDDVPIVPIHDIGIDNDVVYIAMSYMQGGSLEFRMGKNNISKDDQTEIVRSLTECLNIVHATGIVHGDIKPSNILFDESGKVYLSDFGMIKFAKSCFGDQTDKMIIGPSAYASPEQLLLSDDIDGRSDIYALSSVIFQMITGQTPFESITPLGFAVQQICSDLKWHSDASIPAVDFFSKGLAKDKEYRYQTGSDMYEAFIHFTDNANLASLPLLSEFEDEPESDLEHGEIQPPQPVTPHLSNKTQLKRRVVLAGVTMTLILLLALAILLPGSPLRVWGDISILQISSRQAEAVVVTEIIYITQTPDIVIQTVYSENKVAVTDIVYVTTTPKATAKKPPAVATNTPTAAPTLTATRIPATLFPEVAATSGPGKYEIQYNDTIFTIASQLNVDLSYLMGLNGLTCESRLYPGKELIVPPPGILAYALPDEGVSPESNVRYNYEHTLECMRNVGAVAFSQDGSFLAVAQENDIFLWRVQDWKPIGRLRGHKATISVLEFSPDGQLLASGSIDRTIKLWSIDDGEEQLNIVAHAAEITDIAFSPNGKALASSSTDQKAKIWLVADGSSLYEYRGYKAYSVAYSPDGEILAVGYGDFIDIYNTEDYSLVRNIPADQVARNLVFSPDGSLLASSSGLWFVPDGLHVYDWGISPHQVRFTPDQRYILNGRDFKSLRNGKSIKTLSLPIEESERTAYERDNIEFSPNGSLLALGNQDGVFIYVGYPSASLDDVNKTIYTVQTDDNFFTIAEQFDISLATLFDDNGLTCEHVPYPNQKLIIPSTTGASGINPLQITAGNIQKLEEFTGFDALCSDQWGGIAFTINDQGIASGSNMWRIPRGSLLIRGQAFEVIGENLISNRQIAEKASISPNGKLFATVAGRNIDIWDAETGKYVHSLTGHTGQVISIVFSPDSSMLTSSSDDLSIRTWDVQKGLTTITFDGYTAQSLFYMQYQNLLVSQAGDAARIWDLETEDIYQTIKGIEGSLIETQNGNYLAYIGCEEKSGSRCLQHVVNLYRTKDGVVEHTFYGMSELVQDIAFSPDGQKLAIASGQNIVIWDIITKEIDHRIRINDYVNEEADMIRFSSDGTLLSVVVNSNEVRFWNAQSGKLLHQLKQSNILDIEFSESGKLFGVLSPGKLSTWFTTP